DRWCAAHPGECSDEGRGGPPDGEHAADPYTAEAGRFRVVRRGTHAQSEWCEPVQEEEQEGDHRDRCDREHTGRGETSDVAEGVLEAVLFVAPDHADGPLDHKEQAEGDDDGVEL